MWAKFRIRKLPQNRGDTILRSATSQRRDLTYTAARTQNLSVACRMCIEQIRRPACQWNAGHVLQITEWKWRKHVVHNICRGPKPGDTIFTTLTEEFIRFVTSVRFFFSICTLLVDSDLVDLPHTCWTERERILMVNHSLGFSCWRQNISFKIVTAYGMDTQGCLPLALWSIYLLT
jgi:hypothetical protein